MFKKIKTEVINKVDKLDLKSHSKKIQSIVTDMGGLQTFNNISQSFFKTFIKYNGKHKNIVKCIKIISDVIPIYLTASKFIELVKHHYSKQEEFNVRDTFDSRVKELLELRDDVYIVDNFFNLGNEVVVWLCSIPKTDCFKILSIYDIDKFEKVEKILINGYYKSYGIVIQFGESKLFLKLTLKDGDNGLKISDSTIYNEEAEYFNVEALKATILTEYINQLSIDKNIINYTPSGISLKSKENSPVVVSQIDMESLFSEITNAKELNKKRAYVFAGPAGTGKTTIIHKIVSHFSNVPIILVSPNVLNLPEEITNFFEFVRKIKPCIVIFEDLDANSYMQYKNDRTMGTFLECLDSNVSENAGIITFATVNDTSLIHSTLIDRRGRFDRVYFIDVPKTEEEVLSVIKQRVMKNSSEFSVGKFNKLKERKFIKKILKNKLTHSDICEIVDSIFIGGKEFNIDNLNKEFEILLNTKLAIAKCYKLNDNVPVNKSVNKPVDKLREFVMNWKIRNPTTGRR